MCVNPYIKIKVKAVDLCSVYLFMLKTVVFKHTYNDNTGIGRRKQQKPAYRIFTCKFSVSSLQCHGLLTLKTGPQLRKLL